jgi:hypothetical protein
MNQNEFRNDLHRNLQIELNNDLQRYGQVTSDTKIKIERCGYKIVGNKVVYDEDSKFRR